MIYYILISLISQICAKYCTLLYGCKEVSKVNITTIKLKQFALFAFVSVLCFQTCQKLMKHTKEHLLVKIP